MKKEELLSYIKGIEKSILIIRSEDSTTAIKKLQSIIDDSYRMLPELESYDTLIDLAYETGKNDTRGNNTETDRIESDS